MNDQNRERARRLVQKHDTERDAIRANKLLSPAGKYSAHKLNYEKYNPQLAEIKREDAGQAESRQTVLHRRNFGIKPGESGADFRDATDRVGKARTAAELAQIMASASDVGDNVMLRVAAGRAQRLSRGVDGEKYRGIVQAFAVEQGGQTVADLDEYTQLTSSASQTQAMIERMETSISKPAELTDRRIPSDELPEATGPEMLSR